MILLTFAEVVCSTLQSLSASFFLFPFLQPVFFSVYYQDVIILFLFFSLNKSYVISDVDLMIEKNKIDVLVADDLQLSSVRSSISLPKIYMRRCLGK